MVTKIRQCIAGTVLGLASLAVSAGDVTPYFNVQFVLGGDTVQDTVTITQTGTYETRLFDYGGSAFATPVFSQLLLTMNQVGSFDFIPVTAHSQASAISVIGLGSDLPGDALQGFFRFNANAGDQFLLNIAAITNPSLGGVGLLGASVSLVPIPPSVLLFISALAGLVIIRRRKSAPSA